MGKNRSLLEAIPDIGCLSIIFFKSVVLSEVWLKKKCLCMLTLPNRVIINHKVERVKLAASNQLLLAYYATLTVYYYVDISIYLILKERPFTRRPAVSPGHFAFTFVKAY